MRTITVEKIEVISCVIAVSANDNIYEAWLEVFGMIKDFETIVNNTDICEKLIEIINKGLATDDFFKEELFETLRKMGENIENWL
jgi:hypothetical protein